MFIWRSLPAHRIAAVLQGNRRPGLQLAKSGRVRPDDARAKGEASVIPAQERAAGASLDSTRSPRR